MASCTKRTSNIRKRHMRTRGKEARRIRRSKGSTPVFPIHPEKVANTTAAS